MGIKAALARCVVGLSLMAAAAPLQAQEGPDNVASTRDPEDRADARDAADPSDMDRSLIDQSALDDAARDAADDDRANRKPVRRTRLGARPLDSDAEDDNSNEDREGLEDDDGAPKRDRRAAKKDKDASKKDVAKKEPAKKVADKADKDKPKSEQGSRIKSQQKPGGCVEVSYEARFAGVGYDHIVTLKSACKKLMKCVVRTDVNPEPAHVALPPRGEESVVMWRGSPSRAFTPDVTCE